MKYLLVFIGLFVGQKMASAQQIHVLNEGSSTKQGSVGAIDALGNYTHIDSVPAYGNDLTVHPSQNIYSVVDGLGNIREYNFANTPIVGSPFQILSADARQMEYHPQTGYKVVACSQRPYIRIYDANNQLVHSLDTNVTKGIAEGVLIIGNKAYISVNNFGSDSLLQIVDVTSGALLKNIQTKVNPNNLIYDANRQKIYIQIPNYFQQIFEIQELDVLTDSITATHTYTQLMSYGGFTADQNNIYFTNSTKGSISKVDLQTWVLDTAYYAISPYAIYADASMNKLYFSETDYVTSGSVSWIDLSIMPLTVQGSTQTHISPRIIEKTRLITNNDNESQAKNQVYVFGNQLFWNFTTNQEIKICDIQGKTVYVNPHTNIQGKISLENISAGMYVWQTIDAQGQTKSGKFIIE